MVVYFVVGCQNNSATPNCRFFCFPSDPVRAVAKFSPGDISTVVVCLTVLATKSYCPVWNVE